MPQLPKPIGQFFSRVGRVIHTRHQYSEIKRRGGPDAAQLEADMKACLAPALTPIKHAVTKRDLGATIDAIGAVWKAQGKVTDAIERHTKAREDATHASDALIDDLFSKADLPGTQTATDPVS